MKNHYLSKWMVHTLKLRLLIPNITILEEENQSVGVWGQRHAMYLKQRHKVLYMNLLTSGKSNNSIADINSQAAEIFSA